MRRIGISGIVGIVDTVRDHPLTSFSILLILAFDVRLERSG